MGVFRKNTLSFQKNFEVWWLSGLKIVDAATKNDDSMLLPPYGVWLRMLRIQKIADLSYSLSG